MTPREAVASKLTQSTASMITRPRTVAVGPLDTDSSPVSLDDSLCGDDAALAAVDGDGELLGPEIGHGLAVAVDDLNVNGNNVDRDAERLRRILISARRLCGLRPLGERRRRIRQQHRGDRQQLSTHLSCDDKNVQNWADGYLITPLQSGPSRGIRRSCRPCGIRLQAEVLRRRGRVSRCLKPY